jgi:hypothetical protein
MATTQPPDGSTTPPAEPPTAAARAPEAGGAAPASPFPGPGQAPRRRSVWLWVGIEGGNLSDNLPTVNGDLQDVSGRCQGALGGR